MEGRAVLGLSLSKGLALSLSKGRDPEEEDHLLAYKWSSAEDWLTHPDLRELISVGEHLWLNSDPGNCPLAVKASERKLGRPAC